MPYKDKEYHDYYRRTMKRDQRHPAWRQAFLDCSGMCVFRDSEGQLCGAIDGLEFHEIWGEAKNGDNKFQQRALVCNFHHYVEHEKDGMKGRVNPRPNKSQLQNDVAREMALYGGVDGWAEHYGLIHRNGDAMPVVGGFDTKDYEESYQSKVLAGPKWESEVATNG